TEQSQLAHLIDDVLRIGVGMFELLGVRNDLFGHELTHRRQDFSLELGEPEGVSELGHAILSAVGQAIIPASSRRPRSSALKPRRSTSTAAVSCPRTGAGPLAG